MLYYTYVYLVYLSIRVTVKIIILYSAGVTVIVRHFAVFVVDSSA